MRHMRWPEEELYKRKKGSSLKLACFLGQDFFSFFCQDLVFFIFFLVESLFSFSFFLNLTFFLVESLFSLFFLKALLFKVLPQSYYDESFLFPFMSKSDFVTMYATPFFFFFQFHVRLPFPKFTNLHICTSGKFHFHAPI